MNPLPTSAIALIAHALGWTLLHFLWQGALVAFILACLLALLSGRSPQQRYLAACAALVLMTILPFVTFTCIIAAEHGARNTILLSIPLSITATGHGLANPPEPLLYRIAAGLDRSIFVVLAVWLTGAVLLFIRLGIGLVIARRMMSAATQPPPRDLLHVFHRLTRYIEVTRPVRLLHSALVQVPTVIGWLRPVVLIPLGCLSGLSPIQIEAILAHELAHIRRHDYLVSVLQSIVEALLFYHPAVWWVSRHIRREREHCCDDLAVQFTGDALIYARALSLLEERRSSLPAISLAANGGILTMRIKRLLDSKQSPATSQLASFAILGIVIAATAVCIGTAAHAQNNQSQNNPSSPETPVVAGLTTVTEVLPGPEHSYRPAQKTLAKSDPSQVADRAPALKQDAQTLCALQVIGNHSIPSEFVLARLLSKQGELFDPQLVEQDTNMLFNTGYFDEVRIQRVNTDQCVQLAVYVQEKPSIRQVSSNSSDLLAQSNQVSNSLLAAQSEDSSVDVPATAGRTLATTLFSDTRGVDFGPYIRQLIHTISDSWNSSASQEPGSHINKDGFTAIRLTINPDGKIATMHLDASSRQEMLDRAAWGAITGVGQFPPLPTDFSGPNLELRIRFIVNRPATINP